MKRIGPWIFAAGLVVLGAGIVSTRSAGWKKPYPGPQVIALDLQGVDSFDVGTVVNLEDSGLTISELAPALSISGYGANMGEGDPAPVTVIRDGRNMRLEWRAGWYGRVKLDLPPTLASLSGRHLDIKALASVGTLRIDAVDLRWQGDAQALDIRAQAAPAKSPQDCPALPNVIFEAGRVAQLRISIERGEVYLRDLSQVGRIEVHAAPEVSLRVGRIDDLPRIKLLPFDGEPTPPPAAGAECTDYLPMRI
jgi:hypothetical protein